MKVALFSAVRRGLEDHLRSLCQAGVDVNTVDDTGNTLLMLAATEGHEGCVKVLIEAGAELDLQEIWEGNPERTALMLAAYFQRTECANLLIQAGADVNISGSLGHTALMFAARCETSSTTKLLTEAGANLNKTESRGYTALMYAIDSFCAHEDNIRMLIEAGADLNVADSCGETALMLAAKQGKFRYVDLLIKGGCDLNKTCHSNKTALLLAVCNAYERMEELLERTDRENQDNLLHCQSSEADELKYLQNLARDIFPEGILCAKLLLKAGAKINLSRVPWDICVSNPVITTFSAENEDLMSLIKIISVAGERLNYMDETSGNPIIYFPDVFIEEETSVRLDHMCREAIRNHLVGVEPHENLFSRIPRLCLPHLTSFLLLYPDSELSMTLYLE